MMRVAVEGCGHGSLNAIYDEVKKKATLRGWDHVDLVIIGGDFQALRNSYDATCISVPSKYKRIGDFHEYYSGQRVAPYLTIFIGGNHEASNHLFELYYGGWVALNIFYLGAANLIRCGPLRICGMSGIWKGYDFRKSHHEQLPYNRDSLSSIYHVRELDVRKLLQIRTQVDVGLSHDWPRKIEYFGDFEELFRKKRGFQQDSVDGRLGNVAASDVLDRLRPAYWFSGHLHVEFAAVKPHAGQTLRKVDSNTPNLSEAPAAWNVEVCAGGPTKSASTDEMDPKGYDVPEHLIPERTDVLAPATGDQASRIAAWQNFAKYAHIRERIEAEKSREEFEANQGKEPPRFVARETWKQVGQVDNKRQVIHVEQTDDVFDAKKHRAQAEAPVQNTDEINLDPSSDSDSEAPQKAATTGPSMDLDGAADSKPAPPSSESNAQTPPSSAKGEHVSEDIRSQLPASFAKPEPDGPAAASRSKITAPDGVTNTLTRFLALDKPQNRDSFVRLLELEPASDQSDIQIERPFRLQYDKEWLAITRVFEDDLQLGNPYAKSPRDMGEEFYKKRIIEEEAWVEEHIVKRGLMDIPANFSRSAPIYDPAVPITTQEVPPQYNNIQTAEFCELVSIKNNFYVDPDSRPSNQPSMDSSPGNDGTQPPGRGGHRRFWGGGRGGRGGRGNRGNRGNHGGRGGRGSYW